MQATTKIRALALALASAATMGSGAQAAGTVTVEFRDPASYVDIGWGSVARETNLRTLADHMHGWQSRLADGQRLEIDVLDIDLAGEVNRWWRHPEVRVLTGRTDGPRMQLRWTLRSGERVVGSGQVRVSDPAYLERSGRLRSDGALAHDKRLLDDWLRQHVLVDGTPH